MNEPRFIISLVVLLLAAAYDGLVTFFHPQADPSLIGAVFGVLNTGGFAVVVQWWLGSSKQSTEKDQTIQNLSKP